MSKLPEGWTETRIGKVAILRGEKALPADMPDAPFLGLEDVEPHTSRVINYRRAGDMKSAAVWFCPGDVLYSRLRPYLNKVVLGEIEGLASAEFLVLQPSAAIDADFFRRRIMMDDFLAFTASLDRGDRPRVDYTQIANFLIVLPPQTEQRRIVAKLDSLLAKSYRARNELVRVPQLIGRYRQAVLAAAFSGDLTADWRASNGVQEDAAALLRRVLAGRRSRWLADHSASKARTYQEPEEPDWHPEVELPAIWTWASVDQLTSAMQYGTSAKTGDDTTGIPVLRMGNIIRGTLEVENLKYLPNEHDEFPALLLDDGDILFNRTNSAELVGKTAVFRSELPAASFAS
jgi:type I restriction enzyme, S subunit